MLNEGIDIIYVPATFRSSDDGEWRARRDVALRVERRKLERVSSRYEYGRGVEIEFRGGSAFRFSG